MQRNCYWGDFWLPSRYQSAGQAEIQCDGGMHFHRLSVEHSRPELPLFHGVDRGLGQQALAADQLDFFDCPVKVGAHLEYYRPLDMLLPGFLWIIRLDAMKQAPFCHR